MVDTIVIRGSLPLSPASRTLCRSHQHLDVAISIEDPNKKKYYFKEKIVGRFAPLILLNHVDDLTELFTEQMNKNSPRSNEDEGSKN